MNYQLLNSLFFKKLFVLTGLLLPCIIAATQTKPDFAMHVAGKLTRSQDVYKFIHGFKAIPDSKAASLAKTATQIQDAICKLPQLNPPTGFDANNGVATYDVELKNKEPQLKVFCFLRYLENDTHTGKVITSMDGADIYFDINAFDLFDQIGNYWQECDKIKFPIFFEELPITDSSADYIQTTVKGRTVRIIKTNRPLFIPLSRKEFLQFLIARDHLRIKENQRLMNDGKKQIADTKKNISDPLYQSLKSALEQTIPAIEQQIEKLDKEIESLQQKIVHFYGVMNAMSAEEAAAPARLDYNKKSDELFGLEQLVPVDRREGVLLQRINPGYYNYSANAPAAQLITVYYSWPVIGFAEDPDYVQQTALDIFNQVDYHVLKMSIQ